jgi:alkylhydroperoxidase/carboxymuconolactone decarboxylase family protein YurZ
LRRLDPAFAEQLDQKARQLWERGLLSRHERCLATLAVDVVGGTLGATFDVHLEMAKNAGLSLAELKALLRILAEFSTPKAWQALVAMGQRPDAR